ncbi:MAG: EAL domain-containing protein, partial [Spirochaetes bacterium]|nr:EAL domain-containing protein [Spirochaetota bacterium]
MSTKVNWIPILETIEYAFQPIVNVHNGQVFGYEALLRNWEQAGFPSIQSVFDTAAQDESLIELDEWLRLKVMGTFLSARFPSGTKLFYNVDNRLFQYPEYSAERFASKLEESGFPKDSFFIEISENHKLGTGSQIRRFIAHHREHHIRIALDDFGVGYSGLQVLFDMDPDYIKLDRYFIAEIDKNQKKRLFVQHLVEMAHVLGIHVIAEGVETDAEFFACREIGCDLAQGFGIQPPFHLCSDLPTSDFSPTICRLLQEHKRGKYTFTDQIIKQIQPMRAFYCEDSIECVLQYFKENSAYMFVPIVNSNGEPLGVVREKDFKGYLYSPFGYELLKNKNLSIHSFIQTVPTIDIHSRLERFLEVYALAENAETLLVTDNRKYIGCLSQRALLQLIHEKELREARDQNPLTKMKGNLQVNEYLQETLSDPLHE